MGNKQDVELRDERSQILVNEVDLNTLIKNQFDITTDKIIISETAVSEQTGVPIWKTLSQTIYYADIISVAKSIADVVYTEMGIRKGSYTYYKINAMLEATLAQSEQAWELIFREKASESIEVTPPPTTATATTTATTTAKTTGKTTTTKSTITRPPPKKKMETVWTRKSVDAFINSLSYSIAVFKVTFKEYLTEKIKVMVPKSQLITPPSTTASTSATPTTTATTTATTTGKTTATTKTTATATDQPNNNNKPKPIINSDDFSALLTKEFSKFNYAIKPPEIEEKKPIIYDAHILNDRLQIIDAMKRSRNYVGNPDKPDVVMAVNRINEIGALRSLALTRGKVFRDLYKTSPLVQVPRESFKKKYSEPTHYKTVKAWISKLKAGQQFNIISQKNPALIAISNTNSKKIPINSIIKFSFEHYDQKGQVISIYGDHALVFLFIDEITSLPNNYEVISDDLYVNLSFPLKGRTINFLMEPMDNMPLNPDNAQTPPTKTKLQQPLVLNPDAYSYPKSQFLSSITSIDCFTAIALGMSIGVDIPPELPDFSQHSISDKIFLHGEPDPKNKLFTPGELTKIYVVSEETANTKEIIKNNKDGIIILSPKNQSFAHKIYASKLAANIAHNIVVSNTNNVHHVIIIYDDVFNNIMNQRTLNRTSRVNNYMEITDNNNINNKNVSTDVGNDSVYYLGANGEFKGGSTITCISFMKHNKSPLSELIMDSIYNDYMEGNIILDKKYQDKGVWPPVNPMTSISRLMRCALSQYDYQVRWQFFKSYSIANACNYYRELWRYEHLLTLLCCINYNTMCSGLPHDVQMVLAEKILDITGVADSRFTKEDRRFLTFGERADKELLNQSQNQFSLKTNEQIFQQCLKLLRIFPVDELFALSYDFKKKFL